MRRWTLITLIGLLLLLTAVAIYQIQLGGTGARLRRIPPPTASPAP